MIKIKAINVSSIFSVDYLQVNFVILDTQENINLYQFNVYRSNNELDGYAKIGANVLDFSYTDHDVNLCNISIDYFYKIEAVNINTKEAVLSDVIGIYKSKTPDNIASGIIHNYNVYLDSVINNKVYLLKRKHNGQLCNICYDSVRKVPANMNCPVCYATKYVGGYFSPVEINISSLNSSGRFEQFSVVENLEDLTPIRAWTSNFPIIHVNDVIVDKMDNRYIVVNWQPTYKDYYLIKQVIEIQRIPRSDIVYKIPIV